MKSAEMLNSGRTRIWWRERLQGMTDEELRKACNDYIWFSAFAANNPRSDFHWLCDACYDECVRRGRAEIYDEELEKLQQE